MAEGKRKRAKTIPFDIFPRGNVAEIMVAGRGESMEILSVFQTRKYVIFENLLQMLIPYYYSSDHSNQYCSGLY